MKQEVRSAGFSTDSVKPSLMKRLARCRLFIRPAQHIWVSFWPNKTTLCITVKCMENIRSVCPHACVWMSVCLKKRENMFVIKMTEYEGEVPLEGWVATYLHTHTHAHIFLNVFSLLEVQRCHMVNLLMSLSGIKPATSQTSVQHQQTTDTYIFVLTTQTHKPSHTFLTVSLTNSCSHSSSPAHTHMERWLQMWVWYLYTLISERELAVLCVSTSPPLFWLPASSAQSH